MSEYRTCEDDFRRFFIGAGLLGLTAYALSNLNGDAPLFKLAVPQLPEKAELPAVSGLRTPPVTRAAFSTKPTLLNLWGSWCGACQAEHDVLMSLAKRNDFQLFGVAVSDSDENVRKYLQENGNPFSRLSMDAKRDYMRALRPRGVPSTYLFNTKQQLVANFTGTMTSELVETKLKTALVFARSVT